MLNSLKCCLRVQLITAVSIFTFAPFAALAFDVPKGVFRVADLEAAREEAYEEKKPLLILYTYPDEEPVT